MEDNAMLIALVYLVVGFVAAFFGYRLIRIVVALAGFAIFAVAALFLADALFVDTQTEQAINLIETADRLANESTIGGIIATLVLGIIGAFLANLFYRFGIALFGALAASYTAFALLLTVEDISDTALLGGVIFAFFTGGLLALHIERRVIILSTAIIGAFLMLLGGLAVIDTNDIATDRPFGDTTIDLNNGLVMAGIWVMLTVISAFVQFRGADFEYD